MDKILPIAPTMSLRKAAGVEYLLICARPDSRGELDWEWIAEGCKGGIPLLTPADCPLPPFLKAPETGRLSECYLKNMAIDVLGSCNLPLYRKTVGVLDAQGDCLWMAEALVPYAGVVKVITQSPQRYEPLCRRMLDEFGAAVPVLESISALGDCLLAVSPREYAELGKQAPSCPILAGGRQRLSGRCQIVTGFEGELPAGLLQELPRGVDPLTFLSAAFEENPKMPLNVHPKTGVCGSRVLEVLDIVHYIEGQVEKSMVCLR